MYLSQMWDLRWGIFEIKFPVNFSSDAIVVYVMLQLRVSLQLNIYFQNRCLCLGEELESMDRFEAHLR